MPKNMASPLRFERRMNEPESLVLPSTPRRKISFISPETKLSCGQQESLETGSC